MKGLKEIAFFMELEHLLKKYNISISHEDAHGSFILEKFKQSNFEWLQEAIRRY